MEELHQSYNDIMDMPWSRRRRFIREKSDLERRRQEAQKAAMRK